MKKIVYVGLHPQTLIWLVSCDKLRVIGVAKFDYFDKFTLNPINYLSKYLYANANKKTFFREPFLAIWKKTKNFSSSVFFKYRDYVQVIVEKDIQLIDIDDDEIAVPFIKNNDIDLLLVNSWSILSKSVVESPKYGTLNIHPSFLPKYKGALPTLWVLKYKERESAVSYMIVNEKMDDGGILAQHRFDVNEDEDSLSMENKIELIIEKTLCEDMLAYLDHVIKPIQQNKTGESFTGKYYEYKKIVFSDEPVRDVYNNVCLYPYVDPSAYCYVILSTNQKIFFKNITMIEKGDNKNNAGHYTIYFLNVLISGIGGDLKCKLFIDIPFKDSMKMMLTKTRILA